MQNRNTEHGRKGRWEKVIDDIVELLGILAPRLQILRLLFKCL